MEVLQLYNDENALSFCRKIVFASYVIDLIAQLNLCSNLLNKDMVNITRLKSHCIEILRRNFFSSEYFKINAKLT